MVSKHWGWSTKLKNIISNGKVEKSSPVSRPVACSPSCHRNRPKPDTELYWAVRSCLRGQEVWMVMLQAGVFWVPFFWYHSQTIIWFCCGRCLEIIQKTKSKFPDRNHLLSFRPLCGGMKLRMSIYIYIFGATIWLKHRVIILRIHVAVATWVEGKWPTPPPPTTTTTTTATTTTMMTARIRTILWAAHVLLHFKQQCIKSTA